MAPETPPVGGADVVRALVDASPWLCGVLAAVRDVEEQAGVVCWVGAGCVRDLVWDVRLAGLDPALFGPERVKDVDVVFFDPADLEPSRDDTVQAALERRLPGVAWEAKNQAAVHRWYERRFGVPAAPLTSVADAVGTWPETATSLAVRRTIAGDLEVLAPLGLQDLLHGIYRRNPRRVTPAEYRRRLAAKHPGARWPGLRIEPA